MQKLLFLIAAASGFATIFLMQGIPVNHSKGGTFSSSARSGLALPSLKFKLALDREAVIQIVELV
jgi:hypothetical protein